METKALHHLSEKVKELVDRTPISDDIVEALRVSVKGSGGDGRGSVNCLAGSDILNGESVLKRKNATLLHEEGCREFEKVATVLSGCHETAGHMFRHVNETLGELQSCRGANEKIIGEAQALQKSRWQTQWRHRLAAALVQKLKISDQAMRLVSLRASEVDQLNAAFFVAFEEVRSVRQNAQELATLVDTVGSATQQSDPTGRLLTAVATIHLSKQASTDALRETEELIDLGYEKLFFLTQATFRQVEDPAVLLLAANDDGAEIPSGSASDISVRRQYVRQALELCRLRPNLFNVLVVDLVKKRRKLLLRALTEPARFREELRRIREAKEAGNLGLALHGDVHEPVLLSLLMSRLDSSRAVAQLIEVVYSAITSERRFALALLPAENSSSAASPAVQPSASLAISTSDLTAGASTTAQSHQETQQQSVARVKDGDPTSDQPPSATQDTIALVPSDAQLAVGAFPPSIFASSYAMMDYIFSGCTTVMKENVDQALDGWISSPLVTCQIYCLLTSFIDAVLPQLEPPEIRAQCPDVIGESGSTEKLQVLCSTRFLKECLELQRTAYELFLNAWQTKMSYMASLPSEALWNPDFSAPDVLLDYIAALRDVLELCEAMGQSRQDRMDRMTSEDGLLTHVMQAAVAPLLNFIRHAAEVLEEPSSRAVYLLNCYACIQTSLARHLVAHRYVQLCSELMEDQMERFVTEETAYILDKLGFLERLDALRQWEAKSAEAKERQPLSTIAVLHPLSLSACLRSFYNTLFSIGAVSLPRVDGITSRSLRSEARNAILTAISNAYEELYKGTAFVGAATHSPEHIRQLLDL